MECHVAVEKNEKGCVCVHACTRTCAHIHIHKYVSYLCLLGGPRISDSPQ